MNHTEFWKKLQEEEKPHLIFLCLGNICRSPFALMKFEQLLANSNVKKKDAIILQSGGFIRQDDVQIHPLTKRGLLDESISLSRIEEHYPRTMRKHKEDLLNATALIVMAKSHRDIQMPVKYRDKTLLLSQIALDGEEIDIPDPALIEDYEEYKKILDPITEYLKLIIEKMENLGL